MPAAIEFHGVSKSYKRAVFGQSIPALEEISFEVAEGEVCAFLGPNGAGKTTSINLLMGFLFPEQGEIRVLGCNPGDIRAKRQIGFLPENFAFPRYLTGPALLRFHAALAGLPPQDAQSRIPELLARVDLCGQEEQRIGRYSRGMVQRLGIAQALLAGPRLLVLDEPTSGLDPAGRRETRDMLLELKSRGTTVFLSSHMLAEAEKFCDRAIIIDRGRMVRSGPLEELLAGGARVEIVADSLPEDLERDLLGRGATVERDARGVILRLDAALKRETVERIWAAGGDIVSVQPLRSTLEDLFLGLVGHTGADA